MLFDCVTIIGVGLMGGSLGLALRARGLARRVVGAGRNAENLARAQQLGAIDIGLTDLAVAAREADCIVVAAPVGRIPSLLETIAPRVRPDALVTDLGSTKAHIVAVGERLFGSRFVGSHPMAGSEKTGVDAARADLYTGAAWAVVRSTPFTLADDAPATRIANLAAALEARPIPLDAPTHDRLVALVSHLPHILSFAFAHTVATDEAAEQARAMAGGSYRDIMRVSAADPALWRDIFLDNRDALLATLTAYETHFQTLRAALQAADSDALLALLQTFATPSPTREKETGT